MRTTRLIAVLVGMAAIAMVASDASAYYHPGMGVFTSRDPGAGNANRIGAGGPAVGGGFIPRDPTGTNQYADGMNLYQYVGSSPVAATDPTGLYLRNWTGASAKKTVKEQITSWRGSGYNFAADLLQYFLDKKGPTDYVPSATNIAEVKTHGASKIRGEIADELGMYPRADFWNFPDPGNHLVNITHPGKGSDESSNIRWWPVNENKNMLYAYGGADLNATGTATVAWHTKLVPYKGRQKRRVRSLAWSGTFDITLGDLYTFDSSWAKKIAYAASSEAYDAALFLEQKCGQKPFYHKMSFQLTFTNIQAKDR